MGEKTAEQTVTYVEFDSASLRVAPRVYGGVFQLTYSDDEAVLTFGHRGAALPSERGELDEKNFAEIVVFMNATMAENLMLAMRGMVDFWGRPDAKSGTEFIPTLPAREAQD